MRLMRREKNPDKNAYFGDLHVHTANSFDSYTFGNINSPDDAYRYARGAALPHPSGYQIQLKRPLDFYAVTDHGIFLGVMKSASDENSFLSKYDWVKPLHNLNDSAGAGIFESSEDLTSLDLSHRGSQRREDWPMILPMN